MSTVMYFGKSYVLLGQLKNYDSKGVLRSYSIISKLGGTFPLALELVPTEELQKKLPDKKV